MVYLRHSISENSVKIRTIYQPEEISNAKISCYFLDN